MLWLIALAVLLFAAIIVWLWLRYRQGNRQSKRIFTSIEAALRYPRHCQRLHLYDACDADIKALSRLTQLQDLYLSGARLTDCPLPPLPLLQELTFENTGLLFLPNFSQYPQLRSLTIVHNYVLQSFGDGWARLSQLQHLYLSDNGKAPLPDAAFALPTLTSLRVEHVYATALPDTFAQMPLLHTLQLSLFHVKALPPSLAQLPALTALQLAGTCMDQLPVLPQLQSLDCTYCRHIPQSEFDRVLPQLPLLQELLLSSTGLTALPPRFVQLTKLASLQLSDLAAFDWEQALPILQQLPALRELHIHTLHPQDMLPTIRKALPKVKIRTAL